MSVPVFVFCEHDYTESFQVIFYRTLYGYGLLLWQDYGLLL